MKITQKKNTKTQSMWAASNKGSPNKGNISWSWKAQSSTKSQELHNSFLCSMSQLMVNSP